MRLRPASFAWLVAHDMRVRWRVFKDMFARLNGPVAWAVAIAGIAVLHLVGLPAVTALKPFMHQTPVAGAPLSEISATVAVIMAAILAWMIAQSLMATTRMLFDRGDLDLILGSPVSARTVFAARAVAIAASSLGSVAALTLPVANTGAAVDGPHWLAIYPVLVALGLAGTTLGMALAMALFFAFGPKKARVIAQFAAAIIAGAFVLGAQIAALLPDETLAAIGAAMESAGLSLSVGRSGATGLVLDASSGDAASVAILLGGTATAFVATVALLGNLFATATWRAAGAPADARAGTDPGRPPARFATGMARSMRRKEWRLLLRDPNLFAQLSLQMIYTVPIAVVLIRSSEGLPALLAIAPTLVVIATQIASSLAWIAVSGEDAPELIAAAPVDPRAVDMQKMAAIAVPVLAILALPLAGLAIMSPKAAVLSLIFALGGCVSAALLNVWNPMPGKRRGMLRRHSQSKLMALAEHGLALAWAVGIVLALIDSLTCLVPVALALGLLALFSPLKAGGRQQEIGQPA